MRLRHHRPLFADRRAAAAAVITTAALATIEASDIRTARVAGDTQHDEGTARLFAAAMAAAMVVTTASLARPGRQPLPRKKRWFALGLTSVWTGIGLNRWARSALGAAYRPVVTVVDQHEVVTSGPYRLVRHPMYLGSGLICLGNAMALATAPTAAAWALPPVALLRRIQVEERVLQAALGDRYAGYAAGRKRLVPAIW